MEIIKMSRKEVSRLTGIAKIASGEWNYKKASQELGLSKRQLIRLVKRYRQGGAAKLTHCNRGKRSPKKVSETQCKIISELIRSHYEDFGPTLASEQLMERHKLEFSREWVRKLMIKEGIWVAGKQKELKLHQRRPRRSQEGELVQIDGSYENWFEGRADKCCLLVAIDDATSKLQELRFVKHETREDYFALMRNYIERRGRPVALYSDRHAIFKTTRKYDVYEDTQFERAMKELEIELIHANSPQAKGRVERANGTLQDRLIKLMRLDKISTIEEGNAYLEKFREDHNKKFAKQPRDTINVHRSVSVEVNLERILCVKEKRKLSKQLTLQFENRCYQVKPKGSEARRLVGAGMWVYQGSKGVVIEKNGLEYSYTINDEQPNSKTIMDNKELTAFLDRKRPMTAISRHRRKIARPST